MGKMVLSSFLFIWSFSGFIISTQAIYFIPDFSHFSRTEESLIGKINPDTLLDSPGLIRKYGYPVEIHQVITKDGFVLKLHRIPYGRLSPHWPGKAPVYLQHGFVCTSSDWIMNTVDKALPYKLADAGYDVWLGNLRGNKYSMKHIYYTRDQPQFWNFTFHEMSIHDVPSMIDYILYVSKQTKLFYIGHSMGSTVFYTTMALNPHYNSKIRLMISLAPVAFIDHSTSPFTILSKIALNEQVAIETFGDKELVPSILLDIIKMFGRTFCAEDMDLIGNKLCQTLIFALAGFDPLQMNKTWVPVIVSHYPDSTSSRCFIHFLQLYNEKRFCRYNYGSEKNLEVYGRISPPNYELYKVTAPVALYWSDNDYLATPKDVQRLGQALPNVVHNYRVTFGKFNHIDFLSAIQSDVLVYNNVLSVMRNY